MAKKQKNIDVVGVDVCPYPLPDIDEMPEQDVCPYPPEVENHDLPNP